MLGNVVLDGRLKFFDAPKTPAPDGLFGDFSEEPLDEVYPRAARWRKMNVKARMAQQPPLDLVHFVRAVIVHDQVNLHCRLLWHFLFEEI